MIPIESNGIDYDRLLKLRLVVARHGEMDVAKWWNTQGLLGRRGAAVLNRGLPNTHYLAQARVVFEVARSRCRELFDPPGCMTLWSLPAEIEEQFQEHWQTWLDEKEKWIPIFQRIEGQDGDDLLGKMSELDLITQHQIDDVANLRKSAEGRSISIPGTFSPNDEIITLLAAGFSLGKSGEPVIPYAKLRV